MDSDGENPWEALCDAGYGIYNEDGDYEPTNMEAERLYEQRLEQVGAGTLSPREFMESSIVGRIDAYGHVTVRVVAPGERVEFDEARWITPKCIRRRVRYGDPRPQRLRRPRPPYVPLGLGQARSSTDGETAADGRSVQSGSGTCRSPFAHIRFPVQRDNGPEPMPLVLPRNADLEAENAAGIPSDLQVATMRVRNLAPRQRFEMDIDLLSEEVAKLARSVHLPSAGGVKA